MFVFRDVGNFKREVVIWAQSFACVLNVSAFSRLATADCMAFLCEASLCCP